MDINLFPYNQVADTARVVSRLAQAIDRKEPCSMVILGDGESVVLWAAKGFGQYHYLSTYGVSAEERPVVSEQLVEALNRADIICLPRTGPEAAKPHFGPKLREALRLHNVHPKPDTLIGDSLIGWYLWFDGWLCMLLENRKVLVVTAEAEEIAAAIRARTPPEGVAIHAPGDWWLAADVTAIPLDYGLIGQEKALEQAENLPWKPDVCILGAGARASHLCVEIAKMHSIPVIELGSSFQCFHKPSDLTTYFQWYQAGG